MLSRRALVSLAIMLLLCAVAWKARIGDRWTQKVTPGFTIKMRYAGTQTFSDSTTGLLPARDVVAEYDRDIHIVSDTARPRAVTLSERLTIRSASTGKIIWKYATNSEVDPRTGALLDPRYPGEYMLFPREVRKGRYVIRSNFLTGIPLTFRHEEEVDGLDTYVFGYRGPIEYTDSYRGSDETLGLAVPAGQEVQCVDSQFYYRVWVEPRTGLRVKIEEGCPSGGYLVDAAGVRHAAVDRWSGVTAGRDLSRRVAEVRRARFIYLLHLSYIPGALALAGVLALVLAARRPAVALA
jgi:hypothetical protein